VIGALKRKGGGGLEIQKIPKRPNSWRWGPPHKGRTFPILEKKKKYRNKKK